MTGLFPGPDKGRHLIAVHTRHIHVEQDDRVILEEETVQRLLAGVRDDKGLTQFLKRRPHRHGGPLIVIDDEYFRLRGRGGLRRNSWLGHVRRLLHRTCAQIWPATERKLTTLFPATPISGTDCPDRWNH